MKTNTAIVAREYRLQEWAEQIRNCQSRPMEMSVSAGCREHEISVPNYYRLKEVRKAFLETISTTEDNEQVQSVVPISTEIMIDEKSSTLQISVKQVNIEVTTETNPELLKRVLEVVTHVKGCKLIGECLYRNRIYRHEIWNQYLSSPHRVEIR